MDAKTMRGSGNCVVKDSLIARKAFLSSGTFQQIKRRHRHWDLPGCLGWVFPVPEPAFDSYAQTGRSPENFVSRSLKNGAGDQAALFYYLVAGCDHWLLSSSFLMRAFSCSISAASEAVPLAGAT
jgi:hypothetical protein